MEENRQRPGRPRRRKAEGESKEALRHNLCRCGAHYEIIRAVRRAAGLLAGGAA